MKRLPLTASLAGILLLSVSFAVFRHQEPQRESSVKIPLQSAAPFSGFDCDRAVVSSELASVLYLRAPIEHEISDERLANRIDSSALDAFVGRAVERPQMYFCEEFEGSTARLVADWVARQPAFDRDARAVCLALRWIAPRITDLAEPCRNVMASYAIPRLDAPPISAPEFFEVRDADESLMHATRRYLRNPYRPEALHEGALQLAESGHYAPARRLVDELLQIDPAEAGILEDALFRIERNAYPGFNFDIEGNSGY